MRIMPVNTEAPPSRTEIELARTFRPDGPQGRIVRLQFEDEKQQELFRETMKSVPSDDRSQLFDSIVRSLEIRVTGGEA